MNLKHILLSLWALLILTTHSLGQQQSRRLFVFGHSLIDHRPPFVPTPSDETTVPHWLHIFANEANHEFFIGGQFGFLTDHDDLPPASEWGYDLIPSVWDSELEPFSDANIDSVIMTAANFIQFEPADAPHPMDPNTTVVSSTTTIMDWVENQESNVKYYIYLNWPEMNLQNPYPPSIPSQQVIDLFHNQTTGNFTDWWLDYHDLMLQNRPEMRPRLIPVGTLISQILRDIIPGQIPFDELYEDSAPHGRANIYFLASMITYMAIYEQQIPPSYVPGEIIHPAIINNWGTIKAFCWNELIHFNDPQGNNRVFYNLVTENPLLRYLPEWRVGQICTTQQPNIQTYITFTNQGNSCTP